MRALQGSDGGSVRVDGLQGERVPLQDSSIAAPDNHVRRRPQTAVVNELQWSTKGKAMQGKLLFALGAGLGYVLGARAGRERYEAMRAQADNLWHDPRVQEKVAEAGQAVKDRAPEVQAKLAGAADAVTHTVKDTVTNTLKDSGVGAQDSASEQAQPPSVDGAELVAGVDTGAAGAPDVPNQQTT